MTAIDGKVRWGVLGAAKIALEKVIPAMQRGTMSEVVAIASRNGDAAEQAAKSLGIAHAYGTYEALLNDPRIDAIYNPLPNHLHVKWSIDALDAGKHVLCEKPIGMSVAEAEQLLAARDRTGLLVQEAFMVRTHPQWLAARDLVQSGRIGELRAYVGYFSYFNRDAKNIRNIPAYGGGGMMDIGCYLINTSRFIFDAEPTRISSAVDRDPDMGVDRLASLLMEFPGGHAIGTCSTQAVSSQRVHLLGTTGRLEIEVPFNAPPDRPCRIFIDPGQDVFGTGTETLTFDTCDQYTIQGDLFSKAILDGGPAPYPLEDTIKNMKVIEAVLGHS